MPGADAETGRGNAGGAVLQRGAGKDSVDNAGFGQCRQDFVPVCIKCTVGVVAVGVKNLGKHGSFLSVKAIPHKDCATDASSNFSSDETKSGVNT